MSCDIHWDSVQNPQFTLWTKELLYDSLNSGRRPHILSSEIQIKDLEFGSKAPTIEILEIGDVASDKFRGIFKLKYDGEAQITLSTSIQANLLNIYTKATQEQGDNFTLPKFTLSAKPFSMPLFVNLSNIILSGIIVVVFSKSKGLTLVFKNDPLESIKVSSSFDNVQVIEKFLQNKIEHQIRDLFRDILPSVLHKVSQRWTTTNIINELHSKLNVDNSSESAVEKLSIFDINPSEPEISPANMLKLSTLHTSRQSLRLSIIPFHDVIERTTINKHEKNNVSLNGSGKKSSKTIPIEIITRNKGIKLDDTLLQITKIQSKIYTNENSKSKLKRRKIRMSGKKRVEQTVDMTTPDSASVSSDSTLIEKDETDHETERKKNTITPKLQSSPVLVSRKPSPPTLTLHRIPSSATAHVHHANPLLDKYPPLTIKSTDYMSPLKSSGDYYFQRAQSPRRSQSIVGLGAWAELPPPYS